MKRLVLLLPLAACTPDLGDRASLVENGRVLAVRAEPAEAKPGDVVTFHALVASPGGTLDRPIDWAFCAAPRPPGENGAVAAACLADAVREIGAFAGDAQGAIPDDACTLFGPDLPPGGDARPHDPDGTGGYYQPVRALGAAGAAFGFARVLCRLANAPADAVLDYGKRYRANANPRLLPPTASVDLGHLPRGARVTFTASWRAEDAESFVAFDIASQTVVDRREAMQVSWFASAGTFDADRTGRAESDPATTSDGTWTAPDVPGIVHLWIVLRDSRGGVDFATLEANVE